VYAEPADGVIADTVVVVVIAAAAASATKRGMAVLLEVTDVSVPAATLTGIDF
jgi:hypothetical protein